MSAHEDTAARDKPLATGELDRAAAALIDAGRQLERSGDEAIDRALAAVADVRVQLEAIERELVTVALASGRSWAQIGAYLNIIPAPDTPMRYARRRRSHPGTRGSERGAS